MTTRAAIAANMSASRPDFVAEAPEVIWHDGRARTAKTAADSINPRKRHMNRIPRWFPALGLLLTLAVTGCASVPISTMAKLGGFDESDFAALDPQEVRVRVQVPEDFAIDPQGTVLALTFSTQGTMVARSFPLIFESEDIGTVSSGFFSRTIRVRRQTLKLNEPGIELFREAQQGVRTGSFRPREFTVNTKFSKFAPDTTSLRMWVDLQLSAKDGLFPLFDGAKVSIAREAAE